MEDEDVSNIVQENFEFEEEVQLDENSSSLDYNHILVILKSYTPNIEIDKVMAEPEFSTNVIIEEELDSMSKNYVWTLTSSPPQIKKIGCKCVFKTKRDAEGRIEGYNARLVAKGFTQREKVNYNDSFSPVFSKDSMGVIMALTTHFDLESPDGCQNCFLEWRT